MNWKGKRRFFAADTQLFVFFRFLVLFFPLMYIFINGNIQEQAAILELLLFCRK